MKVESESNGEGLDFEKIGQATTMEDFLVLLEEDPDLKTEVEKAISRPDYKSTPSSQYDKSKESQLIDTNLAQIMTRFNHEEGEIIRNKIESLLSEYRERNQ